MRVTSTKTKNSESFYITHSFINENGKSTSKIYKKLGTLKELTEKLGTDRDGVIVWAKQQAKEATEKYKNETASISVEFHPNSVIKKDTQRSFNCGYLFLKSICHDLRFENICRNIKSRHKFDYNIHSILSDLIFTRILSPSSKKSSFDFAHSFLQNPKYNLHDVYRALSVLAKESDYIQSELYKNSNFIHKRDKSILYFDCTNYFFEIEEEKGDKKYGKGKEHRPNPIIGMGLFMDTDGIPLAFDTYPGNQNEQKSLKPLEQKILRDFECSEFIYCSDSGLGSKENKMFNNIQGRKYVITQSLKKLKKDICEDALRPTQFRKLGSSKFLNLDELDETDPNIFNSIYYKEIPLESKGLNEIMIVTYSPKYAHYQKKIRNKQIERAKNMISNEGKLKKARKNPNDPARFIKNISTTSEGEVANESYATINYDIIDSEAAYDGFYAVVTNIDDNVEKIIGINNRRWQIEECFRIMKTEFEARPVYLQRDDRIKAHFLTCFIALLVYRLLEIKLNHKYTVEQILQTLKDMNLCLIEAYGYIPTYKRTELTDALHSIFGFRTDYEIMKKSKIRNIIKKINE